jgi:polysaccharide biosynthesis/export protein
MTAESLLWMIGRATLFTSASALAAALLLGMTNIRAPRIHRAAWMLVVLQVWLLVPIVWQVEQPAAPPMAAAINIEPAAVSAVNVTPAENVATRDVQYPAAVGIAKMLVVVWLGGGVALVVSHAWRYARFVRQLRTECGEISGELNLEWERHRRAAQLRGKIDLRVTDHCGPLVCYVPWQFLVLVPRGLWVALGRRERSAILRHEIAHMVRGDLWWSLAVRMLALPQWFNPLVWLAVRRFDEAGEWACDDWVSRGRRGREITFARSLVATAEFATVGSPGTASAQGGRLTQRIRRLISQRKEDAMAKKLLVLFPVLAIVVLQLVRIEFVVADELGVTQISMPAAKDSTGDTTPPQYVIEPPDVLLINAVKLVPKPPHRIEPLDSLLVRVLGALPDQPIADVFAVDADGKIDLGPTYGRIEVADLTVDEAKQALTRALEQVVQSPQVSVSLAASAGALQVAGEHLVAPDGRVNLGIYGTVYVSGKTIPEARKAIEQQLSEYLQDPQVVVDVAAYNSKKYYVIIRTGGRGDHVVAVPITGTDRVLDALSTVGNLPEDPANKIWISRPSTHGNGPDTILPVRWDEIVSGKSTSTNYRLHPGDRLFVVGGQPERNEGNLPPKLKPTAATPNPAYSEIEVSHPASAADE